MYDLRHPGRFWFFQHSFGIDRIMPRLSVVMACYNAMPYLPAALESIQNQTIRDWEMIVVNDGSTDGSAEYLHSAAAADPRIRVVEQENLGQQAAANRGIELATTDLIARMDADDIAEPHRFEKQLAHMDQHAEVGLLGGQIRRLGAKRSGLESNFPRHHDTIMGMLKKNQHAICNPTVVFRKHLFEELHGYWDYNIAEDWDMFLRMGEIAKLENLDDVLLSYRFHTGSINGRRIVEAQLFNEYAAYLSTCRERNLPEIPYEEFLQQHRSSRWPMSWLFYSDSQSIGQYREAVAEIYGGHSFLGYARLMLSILMSPRRALRRLTNMLSKPT